MIFTDLPTAIDEARYRHQETGRSFTAVQQCAGEMKVLIERWALKKQMVVMFSTRHDKKHKVLPGDEDEGY
jgi:xanthine/CO dehydrogenase XdhC/CoxF family maturation factor